MEIETLTGYSHGRYISCEAVVTSGWRLPTPATTARIEHVDPRLPFLRGRFIPSSAGGSSIAYETVARNYCVCEARLIANVIFLPYGPPLTFQAARHLLRDMERGRLPAIRVLDFPSGEWVATSTRGIRNTWRSAIDALARIRARGARHHKQSTGAVRTPLHYKWPVLADGQDPASLEARLAFHLHRLQLTGKPLLAVLSGNSKLATALSQGRVGISESFVAELAKSLSIPADLLSRDLMTKEAAAWSFYRLSAQNRHQVWRNAAQFARLHNLSHRSLARIIGMHPSDVAKAIAGKGKLVFSLLQAERLSSIQIDPIHPTAFLLSGGVRDG